MNEERLETLGAELSEAIPDRPEHDLSSHHFGTPESTLAFFLTLDAVNFGSGWFPRLRKRAGSSGYFTVATALKERFDAVGPWSAEELRSLNTARCTELFDQDPDDPEVGQLMGHFAEALNDLGVHLEERHGGSFVTLIEAAEHSAEQLAEDLIAMPKFQDVHRYGDLEVAFYKRAQIAAADLAVAFEGRHWGDFRDMDQLTIFADNLVPHVLRLDGVLDYSPTLLDQVDAGRLLTPGSAEEIEIRACALHAVEGMVAWSRRQGRTVTAADYDYVLWNRGQSPAYKAHRRHRARCVYY